MKRAIALLPLLLILTPPAAHGSAPVPTSGFTISTRNVTMPATGN